MSFTKIFGKKNIVDEFFLLKYLDVHIFARGRKTICNSQQIAFLFSNYIMWLMKPIQ